MINIGDRASSKEIKELFENLIKENKIDFEII